MKKKSKEYTIGERVRETIIYLIIIALLIALGFQDLHQIEDGELLDELSKYIGTVSIILFGVIGLFEFAYDNGLLLFVPPSFIKYKEKKAKKQMKFYIESYLKEELSIINQYNNERIAFFLSQLGLSQREFEAVKSHIISLKMMPLKDLKDAEEKLRNIIKVCNIVTNQEKCESKKLLYNKVKYYINFIDIMYIKEYRDELSACLIMLLKNEMSNELNNINKIIIPYSSNRMLGYGVGERIGKSVINVTREPYIFSNQCWEGDFDNESKNHGIVIHDVLVTGAQVLESIKKIEEHCLVNDVFCLVERKDYSGRTDLENKGYKVHSLLALSDADIEAMME